MKIKRILEFCLKINLVELIFDTFMIKNKLFAQNNKIA